MSRLRFGVIVTMLVGGLLFGAGIAHAGWGWWWNAQIDVEGVDVRTAWTVLDDPDGTNDYGAKIKFRVPREADAQVVETAPNETVQVKHSRRYDCQVDGIETRVDYEVEPLTDSADGKQVEVAVTANGVIIAEAQGRLDRKIRLDVFIPTDHPACYDE